MESYNKEYFLKRWDDTVKSSPDRVALVDPTHPEGYTRKYDRYFKNFDIFCYIYLYL